jgi:hypothetical protein
MAKDLYPSDYNPPLKGVCEVCKAPTKGHVKDWLSRCPTHWQELVKR